MLFAVALSTPPAASWLHRFGRRPLNGRNLGEPGWPAAFDLQDVRGRERTAADLRGRVALVVFGYTHCPDTCPTTLVKLAEVLKLLGTEADKVQVVFITIDPERDSAQSLKDYLDSFDPRIIGLSGDVEAIAKVEKAYRVYARKGPADKDGYGMDHSSIVYLMDARGRFVEAFNLSRKPEESAKELEGYL